MTTLPLPKQRTYNPATPAATTGETHMSESTNHPFVGKYVLCRCHSAGVHCGELVSLDGDRAILSNSRRLWFWRAKAGIALSGVAQNGLASDSKVDAVNPEIALSGVIEVIPCSAAAEESIRGH